MDRVVITGAFGYLGLALAKRLAETRPVVAVGHPPRAPVTLPAGVMSVHGDLTLAGDRLADASGLVHLAGGGGEGRCREDPALAARVIARGTSLLAAAARAIGVRRRIFASTIAVYGTFRDHGRPYRETDAIAPDDLYGSLKATAEHVWTSHAGGTALRIANIYGAGIGVDLGISGAVERFARAAARGEELTMYGDGSQRIDYVHIDDVIEAIVRTLDAESVPPVINVGSGRPVSIRELAEACIAAAESLGMKPRLVSKPPPEGKVWPDRSLAIDLAHDALGWTPRMRLEDGVKELVVMMTKQGGAS